MTAFCCFHEIRRISRLPSDQWKGEVEKLPTDCGDERCTTRNCQEEARTRLRMSWLIKRGGKR